MSEALELIEVSTTETENPLPRMTFEEFLQFGDEDTWAEWIDGEILSAKTSNRNHQEIIGFLSCLLGLFVEKTNLGKVLIAPYLMKITDKAAFLPDLLFVSREKNHLIEPTFLNGAADLVVEVISPESVGRDRGEKFVEYESAGVREYWLIDYERKRAEFYELETNGLYRLAQTDGVYHSKVIEGFFVREDWFWQGNLPTIEALKELKIL